MHVIHAGLGEDTIHAGTWSTTIFGNDGDDSLHGNIGNDYLDGGSGNDSLNGLDGDDTFVIPANQQIFHDIVNGGDGTDSINLHDLTSTVQLVVSTLDPIVLANGNVMITSQGNTIENWSLTQYDDQVVFKSGAILPANSLIDAGDGKDLLDYSSYGSGVTVNLSNATATLLSLIHI